jgi:hypothetical protein
VNAGDVSIVSAIATTTAATTAATTSDSP